MDFNFTPFLLNSSRMYRKDTCKFGCYFFDNFSEVYYPLHKPLSLLICIFGIISNGINLIVLTRRGMMTTTNILLTGLSAAQLFLLLNYLSLLFYNYLVENCLYPRMMSSYNWVAYKWVNVNLSVAFHSIALGHTLFLALFRFLAIQTPYYSRKYLNFRTARRCVVLLHTLTPVLCIPTFFTTFVGKIILRKNERCCGLKEYYELKYVVDRKALFQTSLWTYGVVFKLVPSLTISLLSFYLIKSLKHMDDKRNLMMTRRENVKRKIYRLKLTKMFVVITLLCVFVELPHGILNMMMAVFGDQFGREVYDNLGDFFEMLTLLYSSVNFVLYCVMNNGYQRTFKNLAYTIARRIICREIKSNDADDDQRREEIVDSKAVNEKKWILLKEINDEVEPIF